MRRAAAVWTLAFATLAATSTRAADAPTRGAGFRLGLIAPLDNPRDPIDLGWVLGFDLGWRVTPAIVVGGTASLILGPGRHSDGLGSGGSLWLGPYVEAHAAPTEPVDARWRVFGALAKDYGGYAFSDDALLSSVLGTEIGLDVRPGKVVFGPVCALSTRLGHENTTSGYVGLHIESQW